MSDNTQAAEAPATAVEASSGETNPIPQNEAHGANAVKAPSESSPSDVAQGEAPSGADQDAAQTGAAEQSAAEAGDAEAGDAEASGAEAGDAKESADGEDAEAHAAEGGAGGASGAPDPNRKKRRRKRKKKSGKPGEGTAHAQGEGGEERAGTKPAREGQSGVFSRFFEGGQAGKRHAFSAGEVVAGRVVKVNDGAFVVDLFGKALAFVDIFEPHEVPVLPEPPPEVAPAEGGGEASSASPDAGAGSEGGATASVESAEGGSAATESATEVGAVAATAAAPEAAHAAAAPEPAPSTPASTASEAAPGGLEEAAAAVAPEAVAAPEAAAAVVPDATAPAPVAPEAAAPLAHEAEAAPEAAAPATPEAGGAPSEAVAASEGAPAEPGVHALAAAPVASAGPDGEAGDAAHAEASEAGHHEEAHHEEVAAEPEPEPPPAPELGSIFRGRIGSVAESGHVVLVNRVIEVPAAKKRILDAREKRRRVRGLLFGYNRGGFDVLVDGIRVFCPASGISLGPIENPDDLLGQRLEFTVPPVKAGAHGLVVSRRGILERQQRKAAKQLFRSLAPGQRLKGRVTQIREFGLFVDLGGVEGLVHQSELSFSRGVRPQDAANVGDEVDVQVLRVGEGQTRKERERVSLSIKALQDDPWNAHAEVLEPGTVVTGKVVRTTEFGAFIEIAPLVEGLLHISELGRELKHASQVLQEGQDLRVVVERVDRKARRISLSKLSQAEEKALEAGTEQKSARPPKPGQQVNVVVDKVEHAGLIVQVPGVFGRRGRGFIPNSEMGTERGTDHRKGFPPGTEIPAKVIGVDRDGGYRFSRKALMVEEEKRAIQDYRREAARQGLGTFGDLLRKKLEGGKS